MSSNYSAYVAIMSFMTASALNATTSISKFYREEPYMFSGITSITLGTTALILARMARSESLRKDREIVSLRQELESYKPKQM